MYSFIVKCMQLFDKRLLKILITKELENYILFEKSSNNANYFYSFVLVMVEYIISLGIMCVWNKTVLYVHQIYKLYICQV